MIARDIFYRYLHDDREIPQVNTGWHLDSVANTPRLPPPRLDADTESVFMEWLYHANHPLIADESMTKDE